MGPFDGTGKPVNSRFSRRKQLFYHFSQKSSCRHPGFSREVIEKSCSDRRDFRLLNEKSRENTENSGKRPFLIPSFEELTSL